MVSVIWDVISGSNGKIILIASDWNKAYRSWLFPLIHEFIHHIIYKLPYIIQRKLRLDDINEELWLLLRDNKNWYLKKRKEIISTILEYRSPEWYKALNG